MKSLRGKANDLILKTYVNIDSAIRRTLNGNGSAQTTLGFGLLILGLVAAGLIYVFVLGDNQGNGGLFQKMKDAINNKMAQWLG